MTYPDIYPPPENVPPAPPARRPKHTGLIVGATIAVVLAVGGGVAFAVTSQPTRPVAAVSSAPASAADTNGLAVKGWYLTHGKTAIDALGTDFTDLGHAASGRYLSTLKVVCLRLQADIQAAQALPPIPDGEAQRHWSTALTMYATSAADCIAGVDAYDFSAIGKAADGLNAAGVELRQVTARVNTLNG